MRAFLEQIDGDWMDDFVFITRYQLLGMDAKVIPFDGCNDNSIKAAFDRHRPAIGDIIVGSVQSTEEFFRRVGVEVPKYLGYPLGLVEYLNRNVTTVNFGEINEERFPYPFFVKPWEDVKRFTGSVVASDRQLEMLRVFDKIPDDMKVYVSECIDIASEHRCFVHKGKLMGIQFYAGDFTKFPDVKLLYEMIGSYVEPPVAYTLDVAVLDDGSTELIEVNDMWAIGSYGLDAKIYTRMVIDRMMEIYGIKI